MQPVRIEIILNDRVTPGARSARGGVSELTAETRKAKREMEELDKRPRPWIRLSRGLPVHSP